MNRLYIHGIGTMAVGHEEPFSETTAALEKLPESYRTPLVLRHMDDLSYEEIAEVLGQPLGSIKSKIHRGRRMLQERLTAEGLREYIGG